jgi:RNA polymerase sigma-70 factor (ECF subfamily)
MEAFTMLVDRYRQKAFGVAYHMLGDREAAQDAAQEAFIRAYARLDSFQGSGSFAPWLLAIVGNLCIDARRHRLVRPAPASLESASEEKGFEPESPGLSPERIVELDDTVREIRRGLAALPEAQRVAVTLRHVEGLSYEDVAEAMRIPVGTAKTHVHRGRERLARMLHTLYPEVTRA